MNMYITCAGEKTRIGIFNGRNNGLGKCKKGRSTIISKLINVCYRFYPLIRKTRYWQLSEDIFKTVGTTDYFDSSLKPIH